MSDQPAPATDSTCYFFNARELARLSVYRAAVVARFYTDQCEARGGRRSADVKRLFEAARNDRPEAA